MRMYLINFSCVALLLLNGCIETIDIERNLEGTLAAEDVLVVEGVITNELKFQELFLSRAATFQNDSIIDFDDLVSFNPFVPRHVLEPERPILYERNAAVSVMDDTGAEIRFIEAEPGRYLSETAFAAVQGKGYQLKISTSRGENLESDFEAFQGVSNFENLYAERTTNSAGDEGLEIYVDSSDPTNNSSYYRYSYEETYKIIAPRWTSRQFRLTNYDPCALPVPTFDLDIVPREQEEQICYGSNLSETVIQYDTDGLSRDRVVKFPVRFIDKDDFIITHRYSILVHQMVQDFDAYSYYRQLENFAKSDNVFSQVQPGFLEGNVRSLDNSNKPVIGYFSVASVSERRLFFNYEDFFPGEEKPLFIADCGLHSSPLSHPSYCGDGEFPNNCPQSIIERVNIGTISYIGDNGSNIGTCPGPYIYVAKVCGDCTVIGSNIVPDFWEE